MEEFESVFEKLNFSEFIPHRLNVRDEIRIQSFLEACEDFSILESGKPPLPGDGMKFLQDLPPGKLLDDKFAYSLEREHQIIGLIDLIRGYPDEGIWWIGLLLIHPQFRGNGLGSQVVPRIIEALEHLGAAEIRLGVLDENKAGYQFWQKMGFSLYETKSNRKFGEKIHTIQVMQILLDRKLLRIASQ